jgi:AraC-like DNA-binding protein
MGHPVLDEIRHVRLEKVCALLAKTDTSIGAIAGLCGYNSDIALKFAFRKATGMSMREWRNRNRR